MVAFCFLYCIYELIVFAVNPFMEIAIEYKPRDTLIAKYSYHMKPLYDLHLIFSYVMVLLVVGLLIRKICKIPHEYRWQYLSVIIGILIIVGTNAIFLFLPGKSVVNLLDYSIGGYSVVSFIIYWSCFDYSTHGMLNKLKTSIFENIGQGIVLFDDDERLILHNERADFFLGEERLTGCKDLQSFLDVYGLSFDPESDDDSFSLQCYIKSETEEKTLRCDVKKLENKKGHKIGQMFVFTDIALETDMLTGFQKWENFKQLALEKNDHFTFPVGIAVCDINSLSVINSTLGKKAGDQRIRLLAET